jgi:signal transduction histidine kinase
MALSREGSPVDVAVSVAPMLGLNGSTEGVCIIARDLAENRRVEETLREANSQKDAFLAVMSHELRTPLTAILGYADLINRSSAKADPNRVSHYSGAVKDAGLRLLAMVNGLLDFVRLEAGAERLELNAFDLLEVAEDAIDRVRLQAELRHVELRISDSSHHLQVNADSSKVRQILTAYLVNAINFTPTNGRVEVMVENDRLTPGMAKLGVRDTGIGLEPEQTELVWERFYQADSSLTRQQSGVGLGLAIVRHLASLHGGRVWAESPGIGYGSTFWVTLPLAAPGRLSRPANDGQAA